MCKLSSCSLMVRASTSIANAPAPGALVVILVITFLAHASIPPAGYSASN